MEKDLFTNFKILDKMIKEEEKKILFENNIGI